MAYGPDRGLAIADTLTAQPTLAAYAQLPAVRGDLLAKLGRLDEARREFDRAAALTSNERERALFLARAAACAGLACGRFPHGLHRTRTERPSRLAITEHGLKHRPPLRSR